MPEFEIRNLFALLSEFEGGKRPWTISLVNNAPAEPTPPQPPIAQAAHHAPAPVSARAPQSLQRAAQILGPQDEIGALASEMLMRQRPV